MITRHEGPSRSKSCKFISSKKLVIQDNSHYNIKASNHLLEESYKSYSKPDKLIGQKHLSHHSISTTSHNRPNIRILNTRTVNSQVPTGVFPKPYRENSTPSRTFSINSFYKSKKLIEGVDEVQMVKDLDTWENSVLKKLLLPARREPFIIRGVKDITRYTGRRLV